MSKSLKKFLPQKKRWWALIIIAAAAVVAFTTHEPEQEHFAEIDYDPETTPTMFTDDATSYVSDSGYVRYYIEATKWYIYDEAKEPNWKFPEGIYGEKFDNDMNIISTFECDSAVYLSVPKLWELIGNVRINNESGDRFVTQHLFWNTAEHKMYSDSFIHIEKSDKIIEGYGFVSDERISEYEVYRPSMIIPAAELNRDRSEEAPSDSAATVPDTLATGELRRRPPRPRDGYAPAPAPPHVLPGGHVEGQNNPKPVDVTNRLQPATQQPSTGAQPGRPVAQPAQSASSAPQKATPAPKTSPSKK
ncbi:MAG: LPS export ABC transporter periplasmic protein LptC [Bacteroidales bacterium]|nr:LPS export ABC transporter periplasmic protein LptC [Bacteroidales bacterium]MBD5235634.1 LPS export ABC transporter periplasmic protein LptC [Barnesiella sp.]MBD5258712.1 LPS export ABC transporter periplasmic protein LptC [Barnesiella sp.]